eukprot:2458521-Amphidinium_carterae.1
MACTQWSPAAESCQRCTYSPAVLNWHPWHCPKFTHSQGLRGLYLGLPPMDVQSWAKVDCMELVVLPGRYSLHCRHAVAPAEATSSH